MARPGLDKNVKFRRLIRLLDEPRAHVRGYLECLWDVAYENGNEVIGDCEAVAIACDYPGDPQKLLDAMMKCGGPERAGFIESVPGDECRYMVHDLFDHAPEYVKRRHQREKERTSKKRPSGVRSVTGKRRSVTDKRPSLTGQRPTSPESEYGVGATPAPAPAPAPALQGITSPETPVAAPPPSGEEKLPAGGKPRTARKHDELFDAISEVAGADPNVNGAHIGRVCKALRSADPPYTPAEVRSLPSAIQSRGLDFTLTVGAVEKYIGWARAPPPARKPIDPDDEVEAGPMDEDVAREIFGIPKPDAGQP